MAFIRSYSQRAAGELLDVGDPGFFKKLRKRLKVPKAIRKWQPGKTIAKLAPAVLPFVGGPVGILASPIIQRLARRFPAVPVQTIADFAQENYPELFEEEEVGDPGRSKKKRKAAASGTKAKARAKGKKRKSKTRRPSGSKQGVDWGKIGEAATSLLPIGERLAQEIGRQAGVAGFGGEDGLDAAIAGELGIARGRRGGARMPGFGRGRRTMNPANVKALRRSMRRVEGFQKLVKRVGKMFPTLRAGSSSPRRGHKSGCRCVACKAR